MRTTWRLLGLGLVAVTIAAGLRLAFIIDSRNLPDFRTPTPGMDVQLHWNAARILRHAPDRDPAFEVRALSAPLNTAFLGVTQTLLGEDLTAHRFVYAAIGSIAAGLLFAFVVRLTGRPAVAAVAAVMLATQPTFLYLSTLPLKSSLVVTLGIVLLWTAFEANRARTTTVHVSLALLHFIAGGLLFLTQRNTVVMWLFTTLFVVFAGRATARRRAAVAAVLTTCAAAAVVAMRTVGPALQHRGVPQLGIHARVGLHPGATGYYSAIAGIPATPTGHSFVARMAAEVEAGRVLTPERADAHHLHAALDFALAAPLDAAAITVRKLLLFFNDFAPNENYFLGDLRDRSRVLALLPTGFGLLVVGAAWGVVELARTSRHDILVLLTGSVAAVLATNLVTFVTSRYRLSAVVPLAILATIGLCFVAEEVRAWQRGHRSPRRLVATVLAPGLAAGLVAFAPVVSEDERRTIRRTAAANLQRSVDAERALERLAAIDGRAPLTWDLRKQRAYLLLRLQRLTEAYAEFEALAADVPDDPEVLRPLLAMTIVAGDYDRAATLARTCRQRFGWRTEDLLRGHEESVRAILKRFILPRL